MIVDKITKKRRRQ